MSDARRSAGTPHNKRAIREQTDGAFPFTAP